MLDYYLKIAVRNIRKQLFQSAVSVITLVVGFTCFIAVNVISEYLQSWDRHLPAADRIFAVTSSSPNPRTNGMPLVPRHLAARLSSEFPEIDAATTQTIADYDVTIDGTSDSMTLLFVNDDYLRTFSLPRIDTAGTGADALAPNTALITEAAALARFGTTNVVGRNMIIGQRHEISIAGVLDIDERPSHLRSILPGGRPDLIVPLGVLDSLLGTTTAPPENWNDRNFRSYVKLNGNASLQPASYASRLADFSERNVPTAFYASGPHKTLFALQPLSDTAPSFLRPLFGNVSITNVITTLGFLVLLIACLNYSNIVIAQVTRRSHEIAVEKVNGARRSQIVLQFVTESLLLAGIAALIALSLCAIVLISSDFLRDNGFHVGLLMAARLLLSIAVALLVLVGIAGIYPVTRVTKRSLTAMLRGRTDGGGSTRLRTIMVATQFAFSSLFLILAIFVFKQNAALNSSAQSSVGDAVMVLSNLSTIEANELDRLEDALARSSSIAATTRSSQVPWQLGGAEATPLWRTPDPRTPFVPLLRIVTGHRYFETMQMQLLAGRVFSEDYASDLYPAPAATTDATGPFSVVIDDATAARLGWTDPQQAVGQALYTAYAAPDAGEPNLIPLNVIGVVEHQAMEIANVGVTPTHIFMLNPAAADNVIVRPERGATQAALADVDMVWQQFFPRSRARPEFLDDIFTGSYGVFETVANVFAAIAVVSFVISGIGLVGMAAFVIRSRRREVAIRRIHGAARQRVMWMLLKDFLKPVLFANLVAWPVAFLFASAYLQIFYVQAAVTPVPFIASLAVCLALAAAAVRYYARQSSDAHPASTLSDE